jgi:hypothetical protein
MIAAALILALLISSLAIYVARRPQNGMQEPDLDPEAAMKAAVELHRIRRNLDVALTRSEIRRDAAWMRREAEEALNEYRP